MTFKSAEFTATISSTFQKTKCLSLQDIKTHIQDQHMLDLVAVDHWSDRDSSSTDLKLSHTGPGPTGHPYC